MKTITPNDIKEKINSAQTLSEAELFAEKLTYEISYEHKKDSWRTRYYYVREEDFIEMGWKVICVGVNKRITFTEWLTSNGYARHRKDNVYFNADKRELFMIGEYAHGESVSIDEWFGKITIFSLEEYKQLLINKLIKLHESRMKIEEFVRGMIKEHKDFLAQEENEYIKQQIIDNALSKAKEEKLIY